MSTLPPGELLRAMFDAAVRAALPAAVVPPHLPQPPAGRTVVVGAGKASAAMAGRWRITGPAPSRGWLSPAMVGCLRG